MQVDCSGHNKGVKLIKGSGLLPFLDRFARRWTFACETLKGNLLVDEATGYHGATT